MKILLFLLFFILIINSAIPQQTFFQKVFNNAIVTTPANGVNSAWGDYDNDGLQDLVVGQCNGYSGNLILLFHNDGNGAFSRITNNAISQVDVRNIGIAWGDYDNDGLLDLIVGSRQPGTNDYLFHNEGNGIFTRITNSVVTQEGGNASSVSWVDYDRDGWLDLFVANNNQKSFLYHNNGNGNFTKITNGAIVNDLYLCRGAAWADYDNDGWPDLFVVADQGENDLLYHNNGNGTFTKITNVVIVNDNMWGTQCSWGDYDNDGWLDLFVTATYQYGANRLYHNEHNGNFSVSNILPSQPLGDYYGTCWGDYDNDGFIDLHMGRYPGTGYLYKNNSGTSFSFNSAEPMNNENGFDATWGFFNNDGRLNLFVSYNQNNCLYKNVGPIGNYLICKLHGCQSNKFGIGARIILKSGSLREIREVSSGNGNEGMLIQHFGLGSNTLVDSLIVLWPYGQTERKQVLTNLQVNNTITVDECTIGLININEKIPQKFSLFQNYPNPFNPSTSIRFEIPIPGSSKRLHISLKIYNVLGELIDVLVNKDLEPGTYEFNWNASEYPSGIYFYTLSSGSYVETKKLVVSK